MALATFTGRLTDYTDAPFPGAVPELWVQPHQPGFTSGRVLADKRVKVTVASNGTFSVPLHVSASVVPEARYDLVCDWLESGVMKTWSHWATFRAPATGGDIGDLSIMPMPPWAIAYGFGPPPADMTGLYIDITGPTAILYGPDGGI